MTKKIRNKRDLPKWFNLTKYADAAGLSVKGWYEQLHVRATIAMTLNPNMPSNPANPGWIALKELENNCIKSVHEQPIVDLSSNRLLHLFVGNAQTDKLLRLLPHLSLSVRPATANDLYTTEAGIEPSKREFAKKYFGGTNDNTNNESLKRFRDSKTASTYFRSSEYPDWLDKPIHRLPNDVDMLVFVNTSLPDSVLLEDFKAMLQELRNRQARDDEVESACRTPDFPGWVRFGLLPYLDLTTWAYAKNLEVTNRVLADAIFPHGKAEKRSLGRQLTN